MNSWNKQVPKAANSESNEVSYFGDGILWYVICLWVFAVNVNPFFSYKSLTYLISYKSLM